MELTETDRRILAILKNNARASFTELARQAGISRITAKTRFSHLIDQGVIKRFTIETCFDDDKDGMIRAIATIELQGSMSRAVIRALRAIPEITSLHTTNGSWDVLAEIRAENLQSFDLALRKIREIPGVLNSETNLLLNIA